MFQILSHPAAFQQRFPTDLPVYSSVYLLNISKQKELYFYASYNISSPVQTKKDKEGSWMEPKNIEVASNKSCMHLGKVREQFPK